MTHNTNTALYTLVNISCLLYQFSKQPPKRVYSILPSPWLLISAFNVVISYLDFCLYSNLLDFFSVVLFSLLFGAGLISLHGIVCKEVSAGVWLQPGSGTKEETWRR